MNWMINQFDYLIGMLKIQKIIKNLMLSNLRTLEMRASNKNDSPKSKLEQNNLTNLNSNYS